MKKLSVAFGLALIVAGCSLGNGSITDPEEIAKIEIGMTTKAEVEDLFGKPNEIEYDNGSLIWEYKYIVPIKFLGSATSLNIKFDMDEIVESVETSESSFY